jgi:hypothetical protein
MKSTLRLLAAPLTLGLAVWAAMALLPSPQPTSDSATLAARFGGPSAAFALLRPRGVTNTIFFVPKFDPALFVSDDGKQIVASGQFSCLEGAKWRVEVEITQGAAIAQGKAKGECSGQKVGQVSPDGTVHSLLPGTVTVATWRLLARGAGFVPGPASGCGKFAGLVGKDVIDTHEWCADFTLVAE